MTDTVTAMSSKKQAEGKCSDSIAAVLKLMQTMLQNQETARAEEKAERERERAEEKDEREKQEAKEKDNKEKLEKELEEQRRIAKEERDKFEEKLVSMERERQAREDRLREAGKKERQVDKIMGYRDGLEIEVFIGTLEAELSSLGVLRNEWRDILISKLSPKTKSFILDMVEDRSSTYNDLNRLYCNIGLTCTQAGQKLFRSWLKDIHGKTSREAITSGLSLCDRFFSGCKTIDEGVTQIVKALFRMALTETEQVTLDNRKVEERQNLIEAGDAIDALLDGRRLGRKEGRDGFRHSNITSKSSGVKCYSCGREGHKSFECHSARPPKTTRSEVTCCSCGEKGHISPDCPKRQKKDAETKDEKGSIVLKPKGARHVEVVADEHSNVVDGLINGVKIPLVLDTGAQISVVPKYLVKSGQLTQESVCIKGVSQSGYIAEVANIPFCVNGHTVVKESAVVPDEFMNGYGLYSINLRNSTDVGILTCFQQSVAEELKGEASVLQVQTS